MLLEKVDRCFVESIAFRTTKMFEAKWKKDMIVSFLLFEKKRSNFTLIFRMICIYIYIYIFMYIHQTWHGIDMSFPPVPFGKPEPLNLPGSSPYDPEIWSTLDGIKGFRRSSEKVEKLRGKHGNGHGNPPGFPICVFPKIGGFPPNHPLKNRVFHYFHHPFWGTVRIFGNTPFAWTSKNGGDFFQTVKIEGIDLCILHICRTTPKFNSEFNPEKW